jgi:anti-sigma regulatory factor (Ser/Thr protein kinase)
VEYRKLDIRHHIEKYRFEIRHLSVLFVVLVVFQLVVWFVHKTSIQDVLVSTQEWYQQDSAERLANLTTTSLELLLESKRRDQSLSDSDVRKIVQDFNIILSQQNLHQNVQEICILTRNESSVVAIDDGQMLYSFVSQNIRTFPPSKVDHRKAIDLYASLEQDIRRSEQIRTLVEGRQTFHIFVPFVPRGEFIGAVYMKNTPDFSFISREMITSNDRTTLIYSGLILVGMLAMFFISSLTLRERDKARRQLFQEQREHLEEQIAHEKEMLFTKRIYHTHHKAEKVMGFIKEDLRTLNADNIENNTYRITKYANFIARVIYDMKWYDPPLNTIRGPMFRTNINELIDFVVKNIFCRISEQNDARQFKLEPDPALPLVAVNEFVVWEVLEPIIQNSIDHGGVERLVITIRTAYDSRENRSVITIADNGIGIAPGLLQVDDKGVQVLFHEHISTKTAGETQHSGYGCYISHAIATERCGWQLTAANLPEGGCAFTITIPRQL